MFYSVSKEGAQFSLQIGSIFVGKGSRKWVDPMNILYLRTWKRRKGKIKVDLATINFKTYNKEIKT